MCHSLNDIIFCRKMIAVLWKFSNIKQMDLDIDAMSFISDSLSVNRSLKHLNLSGNKV